jgi:hypothetical protein
MSVYNAALGKTSKRMYKRAKISICTTLTFTRRIWGGGGEEEGRRRARDRVRVVV